MDISGAMAALSHLEIETKDTVLKAKSRDFFWYSPVLKDRLDHVTGDFVVNPKSEEEVIEMANGVKYGLSASLWTGDSSRAHRVAENIQAGTVWVNNWMFRDLRVPFGGMKHSGVGREGGDYSLNFFTESQNICIRY